MLSHTIEVGFVQKTMFYISRYNRRMTLTECRTGYNSNDKGRNNACS